MPWHFLRRRLVGICLCWCIYCTRGFSMLVTKNLSRQRVIHTGALSSPNIPCLPIGSLRGIVNLYSGLSMSTFTPIGENAVYLWFARVLELHSQLPNHSKGLRCDSKLSLLWGGISRYDILNHDLMDSLLEAR